MKRLLALTLTALTIGIATTSPAAAAAEPTAAATASAASPQYRGGYRNRRVVRVVTRTRVVRVGGQRYRETIQIRYLPNGNTRERIVSRIRIR